MNQIIYDRLIKVARQGKTVTYGEIAPLANLDMSKPNDRNSISWILGEIAESEHKKGHPMLSAVVVLARIGYPSKGFFKLAKELEIFDGSDDLGFFVKELKKVHDFWKIQD